MFVAGGIGWKRMVELMKEKDEGGKKGDSKVVWTSLLELVFVVLLVSFSFGWRERANETFRQAIQKN